MNPKNTKPGGGRAYINNLRKLYSPNNSITAEQIAHALDAKKIGGSWTCRCPAHDEKTPSFRISESDTGKILLHCFGGCSQKSVIEALRSRGLWTDATPAQQHYEKNREVQKATGYLRTVYEIVLADRESGRDKTYSDADRELAAKAVRAFGGIQHG